MTDTAVHDTEEKKQERDAFVVGSLPCSEDFSPGSPAFFPPQKTTIPNNNPIWDSRTTMKTHWDTSYCVTLQKSVVVVVV